MQVRDLPIGTKFSIEGQHYELLNKSPLRAHVQILLQPKVVHLPNGRDFVRYRGRKVNIAVTAEVEEVLR